MQQKDLILQSLKEQLKTLLPKHAISEVYQYALFPAGKLFRPQLVWALACDLAQNLEQNIDSDHAKLSSFVEMHHSYTLLHDDLPCMDDDDFRRGKESTHKVYGEWKALLAGDGLLNASYGVISKIDSQKLSKLLPFLTWALGPKGLIQGQVYDLSHEMNESFESLLRTHELKTARLIQASLVGSFLLISHKKEHAQNEYRTSRDLFKLGRHLGVAFQLLDDLTELVDENISEHETKINPWPKDCESAAKELDKNLNYINTTLKKYKLNALKQVLHNYFQKIQNILENGKPQVQSHTQYDLESILKKLNSL